MELIRLIKQIDHCRRSHGELCGQIERAAEFEKHAINAEGLYKKNEQLFYALLRSIHGIERFVDQNEKRFAPQEYAYFEALLAYGKSLLKVNRIFPKLTYFFWQKSLGNPQERCFQEVFFVNWSNYRALQFQSIRTFARIRQYAQV